MVKKVEAYTCDRTGGLYGTKGEAVAAEFKSMMREVGGSLPAMGSIGSGDILVWLARCIVDDTYPTVLPKLIAALEYYRENRL